MPDEVQEVLLRLEVVTPNRTKFTKTSISFCNLDENGINNENPEGHPFFHFPKLLKGTNFVD